MALTTATNEVSLLHQRSLSAVGFGAIVRKYIWLPELNMYPTHPVLGRGEQEHLLLERSRE